MKLSVAAIVVLFRPEIDSVLRFINNILRQVDYVILVDNTPENLKNYNSMDFNDSRLIYIDLKDNLGIATAQNEGIKKAIDLTSEYIVIFDQDSHIEDGFINELVEVDKKVRVIDGKVAAVGPTFIDTKTKNKSYAIRYEGLTIKKIFGSNSDIAIRSDYIISSGSLIKIDSIKEIGLMDEKLFIDFVDIEWGIRAENLGYSSYMATSVYMDHTIGDSSKRIPFTNRFINIHSDFRKYFIVRNAIFLILYSNLPLNWKIIQLVKTLFYMITVFFASSGKFNVLRNYALALKDGVSKKMFKGSM